MQGWVPCLPSLKNKTSKKTLRTTHIYREDREDRGGDIGLGLPTIVDKERLRMRGALLSMLEEVIADSPLTLSGT